jgi:hypothetical protein
VAEEEGAVEAPEEIEEEVEEAERRGAKKRRKAPKADLSDLSMKELVEMFKNNLDLMERISKLQLMGLVSEEDASDWVNALRALNDAVVTEVRMRITGAS